MLQNHTIFERENSIKLTNDRDHFFQRINILSISDLQEILEKALGGLRHKLQGSRSNLAEAERYRKQQLLLEKELSRVRVLLAHNSKVG